MTVDHNEFENREMTNGYSNKMQCPKANLRKMGSIRRKPRHEPIEVYRSEKNRSQLQLVIMEIKSSNVHELIRRRRIVNATPPVRIMAYHLIFLDPAHEFRITKSIQ